MMRMTGRILGTIALLLLSVLLWIGVLNAQTFRTGDIATVASDETVNSSLYATGRTIDIAGTIDGDVYCAGLNVTISGTVRGDILCAGQTIAISGNVQGDVRLIGQTANVSGQIAGSASVAASAFSLSSTARVGEDLSAAANDLVLNGQIGRDAALAGATASVNGRIGRNVNAGIENLQLYGQAQIGGGLYYTSANEAALDEGARVAGETKRSEPKQRKGLFEPPYVSRFGFVVYLIISLLIVSLALVLLFPGVIHETTSIAVAAPLKVLLTGFVASLAVPVIILILAITVLGVPLALLLLLIWLVILFLAGPFFGYYIGRLFLREQTNPFFIMALGSFVLLLFLFIPIIGFVVWLAAMWMGSGMLLQELMRRTPKPQYEVARTRKS